MRISYVQTLSEIILFYVNTDHLFYFYVSYIRKYIFSFNLIIFILNIYSDIHANNCLKLVKRVFSTLA